MTNCQNAASASGSAGWYYDRMYYGRMCYDTFDLDWYNENIDSTTNKSNSLYLPLKKDKNIKIKFENSQAKNSDSQ